MALTLVHTPADGHDGWTLSGRLDAAAEADFRATFAAGHPGALLLDLGGVTFIDSKGLGLLAWLTRTRLAAGGRVVLYGARGYLRDAMERVRLHAASITRGELLRGKRQLQRLDPEAVGLFVNRPPLFRGAGYLEEAVLETVTRTRYGELMPKSYWELQAEVLRTRAALWWRRLRRR